jgi:hypothetical protein
LAISDTALKSMPSAPEPPLLRDTAWVGWRWAGVSK